MPRRTRRIDLDTFVSYRLSVLSAAWGAASGRFYRERFGLALREWRVLAVLSGLEDEGAEAAASDLVRLTGVDKAGVSRALASLGRRGLVASAPSAGDARRAAITLTRKGSALLDRLAPAAIARQETLLSAFSGAERARFFALLEKLERRAIELMEPKAPRKRR